MKTKTISEINRNNAFHGLGPDYINKKEKEIVENIRKYGDSSTLDLSRRLNTSRAGVTGRINSLCKKFMLTEKGSKRCVTTGITVTVYGEWSSMDARRNAINQEWTRLVDKRNHIIQDMNEFNSAHGLELLQEEHDKLTKRINEVAKLK